MNDNQSTAGYTLKVGMIKAELEATKWTKIYLNVYVPSASLVGEELAWLVWGAHVDEAMDGLNDPWTTDAWTTIVIERNNLANADAFMDALTGNGAHMFFIWGCTSIYFDSITFA